MKRIQGHRRTARRSYLTEEPDTEFCDPVIRQAREAAEEAQEREDERSGRPGDGT